MSDYEEFRHNSVTCRTCHIQLDAGTNRFEGGTAKDGNVSLCMGCGEVSIYVLSPLGLLSLREPTLDELASIASQPRFQALVDAYQATRAANPDWPV